MSMQPYQQNPIEQKKQQVRKDARLTAIGLGVGVVSVPVYLFASTFFIVFVVAGFAAAGFYGNRVRKAIKKSPNSDY